MTPWTAACQPSLSITNSWSLLKLTSIELMMPSNHLILCHPLLLSPSIFPSIRVFSNESVLRIRCPNYWSFSFNITSINITCIKETNPTVMSKPDQNCLTTRISEAPGGHQPVGFKADKPNVIWGHIKRGICSQMREVIILLPHSALATCGGDWKRLFQG